MRLDIRFTTLGLETLWTTALVGFPFRGDGGEDSGLRGLEEKTGGFLKRLRVQGFWNGELGETLLFPSEGRVQAQWILLKGLGKREAMNPRILNDTVSAAGEILSRLAIVDFGVHIPLLGADMEAEARQAGEPCRALVERFLGCSGLASDALVKVVFCTPAWAEASLGPVIRSLRKDYETAAGPVFS